MKLDLLERAQPETIFKAEFIAEISVPTPDLYLLIYRFNVPHYSVDIQPTPSTEIENTWNIHGSQTGKYAQFHLTRLNHIVHGYFIYNNKKIEAQVGYYVRRSGVSGFVPVLLYGRDDENIFENAVSNIFLAKSEFMIVDFEDFNKTRKLIGQSEYTFEEYLTKRISEDIVDENGFSFDAETSLFSPYTDKLDFSNLMNSKGITKFLKEQRKK